MSNDKDRRVSTDSKPKRRRTAATPTGAAGLANLTTKKKPDGAGAKGADVKADALETLDIPEGDQIEYGRLMHRKSFNDIFADLSGAQSEGIRAIAAAAKARQSEDALQANQVQANMQHLQQVQAAQQLQHVSSSLSAATAAAMAVAQASNMHTTADPSQQVAQQAARAAAEAAQQHSKPRPGPVQFNAGVNPNIAAMLAKQQPGMFSPTSAGTPTMFSPNGMGMASATPMHNAMNMILQQNQNGMATPTTPSAMNAFSPALQAQVLAAQQAQAQSAQLDEQDKKVKRLAKNRIAAKECRLKKKKYVKCLEERVKLLEERNEKLLAELEKLQSGKMSEEEKRAQQSRIEKEYKQDVGNVLPDNPETPMLATTPGGGGADSSFTPAAGTPTSAVAQDQTMAHAQLLALQQTQQLQQQQQNVAVLEAKLANSTS